CLLYKDTDDNRLRVMRGLAAESDDCACRVRPIPASNSTLGRTLRLSCSERPLLVAARQSQTVCTSSWPRAGLRKREYPRPTDEPRERGSCRRSFATVADAPIGGHPRAAYDGQ